MRRVLIVGATSAIAQSVGRIFAGRGDRIFLAGRNSGKLDILAKDLSIRGAAQIETMTFEANDFDFHSRLFQLAEERLGGIDVVLLSHGTLPDQKACEQSAPQTLTEFSTNALSTLSLLTIIANRFEEKGTGTIMVLSSVAGDRGRKSNYVYGASKGAVTIFLQGLRNRLAYSGVHVMTIKPGFVNTPMTSDFPKGPLWASPDKVAKDIIHGMDRKQDILYTPFFWRWVMFGIKIIPEKIFKKMSL